MCALAKRAYEYVALCARLQSAPTDMSRVNPLYFNYTICFIRIAKNSERFELTGVGNYSQLSCPYCSLSSPDLKQGRRQSSRQLIRQRREFRDV